MTYEIYIQKTCELQSVIFLMDLCLLCYVLRKFKNFLLSSYQVMLEKPQNASLRGLLEWTEKHNLKKFMYAYIHFMLLKLLGRDNGAST